jgi:peroxiredoxin
VKYVRMITLCLVSLVPAWSFADDPKAPDQPSPREQLQALRRQANQDYQAATAELAKMLKEAKSVEENGRITDEKLPGLRAIPNRYAGRILKLAQDHPSDPVALEALEWVVTRALYTTEAPRAFEILTNDYLSNEKLLSVCQNLKDPGTTVWSEPAERFLRVVLEKNPHRPIQAFATFGLAMLLKSRASLVLSMRQAGPDRVPLAGTPLTSKERAERILGREVVGRILAKDPRSLIRESTQLMERVSDNYADVPIAGNPQITTLGAFAARHLLDLHNMTIGLDIDLSVGAKAPEIEGEDLDGKPFKLSEYRGKVVVLCFWATYCGPCRAMVPHDKALVNRLGDERFAFVGINADPSRKQAQQFVTDERLNWRSWWDGDTRLSAQWNAFSVPTIYVIDQQGVIRFKDIRYKQLDDAVDQLLKEKP